MSELIKIIAAYLHGAEISKKVLFDSLVTFPISDKIAGLYDPIRACERKGMRRKEILPELQKDGLTLPQAEDILIEYRAIRKILNSHRGKSRFRRGLPILLLGLAGFVSAILLWEHLGPILSGLLCILSFIFIIIAAEATFGGLLQIMTGWD